MYMLEQELRNLLEKNKDILYGFAGTEGTDYNSQYPSTLVMAIPYDFQETIENYTEEKFDQGINSAKKQIEDIHCEIEEILKKRGISYWIPPVAQENETELLAKFSFKFAAVKAGIGWIGKNDVVVTKKYGPRIRLSAILIDSKFEYGLPYTRSECPEDCVACVEACPCNALKNKIWTVDSKRAEIIDYQKCNRMRSAFIEKLGRKNACGLCMVACPMGRRNDEA